MTRDDDVRRLVAASVGPAPWYWTTFPAYRLGDRRFTWRFEHEGNHPYRPQLIEDSARDPVLVVDIYTRAIAANPGCAAIWFPPVAEGEIEVAAWRLDSMAPCGHHPDAGAPSGRAKRVSYRAASPPDERVGIPNHLPAGPNKGPTARLLDRVPEVLLLAGGPPASELSTGAPEVSIYVWRPADGLVEVLPQTWFTATSYDLGYEWITRVARDPASGRMVGGGIRIPDFELDDGGTRLLRTLQPAAG